ncbi:MAG: hypothetical protein NTY90_04065 [Candidatus Micrarchaeota archaeon]|nr:hypothetical protein [Candidatus Micrarchaeota archaeon]
MAIIPELPPDFILTLVLAAVALVAVVLAWFFARRPKPPKAFELDKAAGAVKLFPGSGIEVTLRAFRLMPDRGAWGFDVLVKNRGDALEKLVLEFNGAKTVVAGLAADALAIKPVEIRRGKKRIGKVRVALKAVPELEFNEIVLPMNEILEELRGADKIALIQETRGAGRKAADEAREREAVAREFQEMLEARRKPRPATAPATAQLERFPATPATSQVLKERLAELAEEERQAQVGFMKRELSEAAFSDVMKKVQSQRIEAKAKLARLEAAEKRQGK